MLRAVLFLFLTCINFTGRPLHGVEAILWHRTIGTDATGNGVFISKLYSPDSGYNQFSLFLGVEDNTYFTIQNTDEIACASSIPQGSYTVVLRISDGTNVYIKNIVIEVVAGSVHPKVSLGDAHTLVLTSAGEIYSFGQGTKGRLGNGSESSVNSSYHVNDVGSGLDGETFIDVIAGNNNTFLLTRSGTVFACGSNVYSKLGIAGTADTLSPTEVTSLSAESIVRVGPGIGYTSFLTAQGEIFSVGRNNLGQLGISTTTDSSTPVSIQQSNSVLDGVFVIDIQVAFDSTTAVTSSGLYSWGAGGQGTLGLGDNANYSEPQAVSLGFNPVYVGGEAGYMTYTISDIGLVYSSGLNNFGQLGLGDTTARNTFTNISTLAAETVFSISGGWYEALVLTNAGDVYGIGNNSVNQIGPGTTTNRDVPTIIAGTEFGSETVTQVHAAYHYSFVLTDSGNMYGIGQNSVGQLGLGNNTSATSYAVNLLAVGSNARLATYNPPSEASTEELVTAYFYPTWTSYNAVVPEDL